jgi:hypothetical protein
MLRSSIKSHQFFFLFKGFGGALRKARGVRGRSCIKAAWKLSDASSGLAFGRVTIDQKPKISGKEDVVIQLPPEILPIQSSNWRGLLSDHAMRCDVMRRASNAVDRR